MEWKVQIQDRVGMWGKEITIFRKVAGGHEMMCNDFKTTETIKEGEAFVYDKHAISLEPDIFKALVDAIHKDYKPSEGKFTEGKLEATESHLGDLRQLLKLK